MKEITGLLVLFMFVLSSFTIPVFAKEDVPNFRAIPLKALDECIKACGAPPDSEDIPAQTEYQMCVADCHPKIDLLHQSVEELQTQIDSFFDVFVSITSLFNVDSFFDVFVEIQSQLQDLQAQINNIQLTPGPQGEQGPEGPQGPPGINGSQGPQGLQGDKGDTGNTGPQGPAGTNGSQGAQGLPGVNGTDGAQGLPGVNGTDGAQGLKGDQGTPGQDGLHCWDENGDGICQTQEDKNGDSLCGALDCQGPQGPSGANGTQGPAGINGSQGPQGPQGPAGPSGTCPPSCDDGTIPTGPYGTFRVELAGGAGATEEEWDTVTGGGVIMEYLSSTVGSDQFQTLTPGIAQLGDITLTRDIQKIIGKAAEIDFTFDGPYGTNTLTLNIGDIVIGKVPTSDPQLLEWKTFQPGQFQEIEMQMTGIHTAGGGSIAELWTKEVTDGILLRKDFILNIIKTADNQSILTYDFFDCVPESWKILDRGIGVPGVLVEGPGGGKDVAQIETLEVKCERMEMSLSSDYGGFGQWYIDTYQAGPGDSNRFRDLTITHLNNDGTDGRMFEYPDTFITRYKFPEFGSGIWEEQYTLVPEPPYLNW